MKTYIAILTALVVLSFSAMGQDMMSHKYHGDTITVKKPVSHKPQKDMKKAVMNVQQYTCPAHLEVITNKPGKCPKCGVTLVKVEGMKSKEMKTDVYTCTMHPEVKSDKPGKCPICKMHLVKKEKDK